MLSRLPCRYSLRRGNPPKRGYHSYLLYGRIDTITWAEGALSR